MIRTALDTLIYLSCHMVLVFGLAMIGLWLVGLAPAGRRFLDRWLVLSGPVFVRRTTALGLLVFVAVAVWYLRLEGFAGEVEPMVSSLSWLVQSGHPLYHDLQAAERYSVLYGPSVFLTNGLFLRLLGPSLLSVKLASALAGVGSLLCLYGALARRRYDLTAVGVTGLALLFYWSQGFAVYLVRPDALILFTVAFGLYLAVRVRRGFAVAGLGVLLGFVINLKIHGGIYFLPVLALAWRRWGARTLAGILGLGLLVAAAPFCLHPQVSWPNYVLWLRNAMHHGLGWVTFAMTLRFAVFLALPLGAVLALRPEPGSWLREQRGPVGALAVTLLMALAISNKPGAGLVHLLPVVPTALFLAGLAARDIPTAAWLDPRRRLGRAAVLAVGITALLAGAVPAYRAVRLVDWQCRDGRTLQGDLVEIMGTFPDLRIAMACGGEAASFRHTWLRPLLVFRDNPLLLDPISVMDCMRSGQDLPHETFDAMSAGLVDLWLVPRQEVPFDKANWYPPHAPVFSPRFIEHFRANYSPRGHSQYFDLWFWNGLTEKLQTAGDIYLAGPRK